MVVFRVAEGVFTVTVTATNALSNVTTTLAHPVYIQVPVQGPLFKLRTELCTRFGEDSVLRAEPVQGSNVTFTWKLDDQTEIVNASESLPLTGCKIKNTIVKEILKLDDQTEIMNAN